MEMDVAQISPDQVVIWEWGFVQVNATLIFTWFLMALLVGGSWWITRRLTTGPNPSRWQNFLEVIVDYTRGQIREISGQSPNQYLPFIGTLFLFIAVANAFMIVPYYLSPTGSLSTAAALAICVFVAVPIYGVINEGFVGYLKHYVQPNVVMLPFHVIGELSRTLALAVRLFGNIMSGAKIGGILLAVAPLFFPILMNALGLLTGLIQAYIFAILAMIYIASGSRSRQPEVEEQAPSNEIRKE
jgi:F-type H+-transporting ATPase subunit a